MKMPLTGLGLELYATQTSQNLYSDVTACQIASTIQNRSLTDPAMLSRRCTMFYTLMVL